MNATRGDDGQARPDAENVDEGAGQEKVADADAGHMQDGAAWHEGLLARKGVKELAGLMQVLMHTYKCGWGRV